MKARIAALVALSIVFAPIDSAEAPSAERVVASALEAIGGEAAWKSLETMEWRGEFTTFSTTHPFLIQRQRPNLYRFEYREADREVTAVYDGHKAWWRSDWIPFAGVNWPTAPSRVYARGFEADAEFLYPYLDPANRVESKGMTDWDGVDAWELAVTLRNGLVETWYLDSVSFLPLVRISRAGYVTGLDREHRMFFSEFRTVAGVQMPYYIETELGNRFGIMEVGEIKVNQPIEPGSFAMPIPQPMERLSSLAGKWRVMSSSRQLPTQPFVFQDEGTSVISSEFDGQILEEQLFYHFCDRPRNVKRIFSFDRFKNQYRILHLDDLTNHPVILQGSDDLEKLSFDNANSSSEWGFPGMSFLNRMTIKNVEENSFSVEWDHSADGGQLWATLVRFNYSRIE